MSVLLPKGHISGLLRAYSDPVIYRDDRVLKTLLRKEIKYLPSGPLDLRPLMRKEIARWMLEICEAEQCQPEIFCLAMNYLDRFLSICKVAQSQLQLLAGVCLLVAFKVRQHQALPVNKLVEYSDFNLDVYNIMEWEVLLLSKLDWDMSAVIALDFVEHIIQRVQELPLGWSVDMIRRHSETLVAMCAAHHSFYSLTPSLVAAACVLTTLRPLLEATQVQNFDPDTNQRLPTLENALQVVEQVIFVQKVEVEQCMDKIEAIMKESVNSSLTNTPQKNEAPPQEEQNDEATPTKVLDVINKQNRHQ